MAFEFKDILATKWFQRFLYRFIRMYSWTFRLSVENEKEWMDHLGKGGSVIICTWHQQFFPAIRHFRSYRGLNPSLMISKSRDGEIIAGVANQSGWQTVRGSSSRGGAEALRTMIENLRNAKLVGHIVDGPRGPAGTVKAGVIRLAHAAGGVVVPFYTMADRAWYFRSWDNFFIPKPFARVKISFDRMIQCRPTDDTDEFERQRLHLEKVMTPHLQGRLASLKQV